MDAAAVAAGERGPALSARCSVPETMAHPGVRKSSDMARSYIDPGDGFDYWDGESSCARLSGSVPYVRGMQRAAWDACREPATHHEMQPGGA